MAIRTFDKQALPSRNSESSFSLLLQFDPLQESPSSLFRAAAQFADAFQTLDSAATHSIDGHITTSLTILGFENGSLRTWFASILRSIDDEALKDLNLKKLIGAYLVRVKYAAVDWLEDDNPKKIVELEARITEEAIKTDVRLIPAYSPPSRGLLLDSVRRLGMAKELLADGDEVHFESKFGTLELDTRQRLDVTKIEGVEIASETTHPLRGSLLTVKKPDYLGHSQWQLKFGDRTVRATIADQVWLARFHSREVGLQPGDAIKVDGEYSLLLDKSGAPLSERVVVKRVYGVEYQPYSIAPPLDL
ncbi:MAG: hypothetical protein KKG14_01240 [Alphaproteobacteria bacterium]|nr:hypothetical protein [Alphaproteobacteria bacterium]MBU2271978.1 hypothetical protein [Alphaproteobacteria bacterium]MBU2417313.1 hypothetical protein [Alphaproteobacteria bacterium]